MTALAAEVRPANLSPAQLSAAREAFVARVDAAADRAMRRAGPCGMAASLIEASCYLAAHGIEASACRGETFFNWDIATSCRYLDGLAPADREAEVEAGRRALFEGRRTIVPDLDDLRCQSAVIVDLMEMRWARQQTAYFTRKDAEQGVAHG